MKSRMQAAVYPVLFLLNAALLAIPAWGQNIQGLPRVSPKAVLTQAIGVTEVTVSYHRPQVNDRKVYGSLVPYGAVWRAGANDNTTITFSDPVKIEGETLASGTYGLHMLPTEDQWSVIFSHNSTSWGSFTYDSKEDALRVRVKARKAPFQEALDFRFDDLSLQGATLALHWAELEVPFRIEVDTHALVLTKIRNDLRSLPGFSWTGWMSAANYCLTNNINHEEALQWADRSIGMKEDFGNLMVKAGLLEQVGRGEEAAKLAHRLLTLANEAETNQLGYFYLQGGRVKEAIAVFEKNVKDYPSSWNVYDSLGESQAAAGMKNEAIENYSKALELAPDPQRPRITAVLDGLRGGD